MKRVATMAAAVCATAAASAAAFAYVPPGGFLLGKVAEQRNTGGLSEFTVEGVANLAGPSGEISGEAQVHVNTSCCIEISVLAGKKEIALKIGDGKKAHASPELKGLADALAGFERGLLLMFPGRGAAGDLVSAVRSLGVETETTSLARFFGRIAIVIGAPARDRTSPQIWIDKDSYQALRLMLPRKGAGKSEMLDIRLTDYQHSPMPTKLPRVVEIALGQTILFKLEADKVYAGAPAAE
ncbi:MAG: hypothetical protein HY897_23035 [Deltaproteobacteria bacterium]|nr:hypothetical protein [Deltaproteobacteria bacterium]